MSQQGYQEVHDKQPTQFQHTQVKMEDASTLLKLPKSECPDIWIRLPRHILLNEICVVTHLLDRCGNHSLKKVLLGLVWEKEPNWECLFVHRKQGLFQSEYVDDIKLDGRKQNLNPKWKEWMKLG